MSTPRHPDIHLMWQIHDDETACEWLRLVDSFVGGLFVEPGEHTDDPAQVVFLLYLIGWTLREQVNYLVFEPHKERLAEMLEQWSVPLGGTGSPQYPFWRLQSHRFWRLTSWNECCERLDLPASVHGRFRSDASVGVLDERAWLALMSDDLLRHNLVTYPSAAYWPNAHQEVQHDLGLDDMMSFSWSPRRRVNHAGTPAKPRTRPTPTFRRNRTYATDELCEVLELPTTPEQCPFAQVEPGTTALLISDSSWRMTPSTDGRRDEIHWPFSNRRYDNWLVLAEISDADRLKVFTKEPTGDAYRYRGVYELVSLEQRRWSFIRRIHDIILRATY